MLDYYYHLRYDDPSGAELTALTDALVVNETFFFRERAALEQVIEWQVAPLCAQKRRPRIWSAAAATGEEPYTLAMLLAERGLLQQVELIATDVSQRALTRVRSGVHARRSLREGYPTDLAAKYLRIAGEKITVVPAITAAVLSSASTCSTRPPSRRLVRLTLSSAATSLSTSATSAPSRWSSF